MRFALISDVHGNLVPLQAVVEELERESLDGVVCLGDVAATGPQPRETVELLMELDCLTVMGNADAEMLRPISIAGVGGDARRFAEMDRWCAGQFSPGHLEYLRTFRETVSLDLGDGYELLCFHGSPYSFDDTITATTPEGELERLFSGAGAGVAAGGHTHAQMLRRSGEITLVNPGSVGMTVSGAEGNLRNPPWAEYAVISQKNGSLCVELRRVPVDVEKVRRSALHSQMPHAEWWASGWSG